MAHRRRTCGILAVAKLLLERIRQAQTVAEAVLQALGDSFCYSTGDRGAGVAL
jgi:hypothetical protein